MPEKTDFHGFWSILGSKIEPKNAPKYIDFARAIFILISASIFDANPRKYRWHQWIRTVHTFRKGPQQELKTSQIGS